MTPDTEIIEIFLEADDPVLGTQEVADELGYSHQGTGKRLNELVDEGKLQKKKIGQAAVYWHPDRMQ